MLTQGRKSRTGCLTCKIRRVKCDEQKPSCLRCTKTGRKCDGYSGENFSHYRTNIAPKSNTRIICTVSRRLLPTLPGDEKERRHFLLFRDQTVPLFSAYYDTNFWSQLILQLSQAEPAVRHAVVALASLHRAFMNSGGEREFEPAVDLYGLQQYNKALAGLNKSMFITGETSTEVVLICCILFVTYDMLRGDFRSAGKHILSGLRILTGVRQTSPNSSVLQDDLEPMFVRLSIQTKSIFDAPSPSDDPVAGIVSIATAFSSLTEARNSLNSLMNQVFNFVLVGTARVEEYGQTQTHHEADLALIDQAGYISLLERWQAAFDGFLSQQRAAMSSKYLDGAILLKIHYAAMHVMLFSAPTFFECIHDVFLLRFEEIVSLAKALIKQSDGMLPGGGLLWVETGIIPPLFLTAWKCRDPLIRREAASLLSTPRREGAWDSIAAASLAERIIAVEEAGLPHIKVAQDVPESSRIYTLKIKSVHLHAHRSRRCIFDFFRDAGNFGSTTGITEETVTW